MNKYYEYYIYNVIYYIYFIILSLSFTKLVQILQGKCFNEKIVTFIDVLCFLVFTVYGFALLYIISIAVAATSSDSTINYMLIVYIRNFVGLLCGFLYSFLVNYRQMSKYLEKFEQKENVFLLVFILLVFLVFCFVKLCHTWSL